MNTHIVLLGASGQVGGALAPRLARLGDLTVVGRADADLARDGGAAAFIERLRPRLIVNAAAYTAVDRAESDPEAARRINADAVGEIAVAAKRVGAAVVHFSTDYVYDGTKGRPYVESDAVNPLNEYGRTKLAGDEAIARSNVPHLIFRTSWVYSAGGRNFRRAIIARARETGTVRVVDDQIGAPTTAEAIADAVVRTLGSLFTAGDDIVERIAAVSGVYHLSARGATTWYEFARVILSREGIDAVVEPISTADFGAPARRPAYSILDNGKLERVFGVALPEWPAQLEALGTIS